MSQIDADLKTDAEKFLTTLQSALESALPPLDELRLTIRRAAVAPRTDPDYQNTNLRERVFINKICHKNDVQNVANLL